MEGKGLYEKMVEREVKKIHKIHNLKIKPEYFKAVISGKKKFETRLNDRDFKEGDFLQLEEFDDKGYTGKYIVVRVDYVLDDPEYCKNGYVTMSITHCLERGAVI